MGVPAPQFGVTEAVCSVHAGGMVVGTVVPGTVVGTVVPGTVVGTVVPGMVVGTVVPGIVVGTVVPGTVVGTVVPGTVVGTVVPGTVVGTVVPGIVVGTVGPGTYDPNVNDTGVLCTPSSHVPVPGCPCHSAAACVVTIFLEHCCEIVDTVHTALMMFPPDSVTELHTPLMLPGGTPYCTLHWPSPLIASICKKLAALQSPL